jgi:hypothetical protein
LQFWDRHSRWVRARHGATCGMIGLSGDKTGETSVATSETSDRTVALSEKIFATEITKPHVNKGATFGMIEKTCGLTAAMCGMTAEISVTTGEKFGAITADKFWACPRGRAARTAAG